jgi:hypothetical protein
VLWWGGLFYDAVMAKLEYKALNASKTEQTQWLESARDLYRASDRSLSAKLVLFFEDTGVSHSQRG